ncbi:hypothetical protein CASFOL_029383 [Castilleja foliolosa]|uniref:Remorin C-terminal domain-containing protein n=1 Tax=Castilleja foliolosa TaxID=1961234 RepID=A0ABD3CAI5_9LAMI
MTRNHGSSFRISGPYTSPGTPEYGDINNAGDIPKTWSSERVPLLTSSSSRRHISAAALMPFNSGRALPSKWDDAERWITSPVSGYGAFKISITNQAPHHRRPKSKSGPLGPTGPDEGGSVTSGFMGSSPLTMGVLVPDGCLPVSYGTGIGVKSDSLFCGNNNYNTMNNMTRSTSVPGLSDLVSESSARSSQDDNKLDGTNDDDDDDDDDEGRVSRRDMATQISPQESTHSSSRGRLSFSKLASSIPNMECTRENHASRDNIRDVQEDKITTTANQSKKLGLRKMGLTNTEDLVSPSRNAGEASKNIPKLQRDEAKINAWENLQKAKAEAAIRKLEMKLEKKRSSSMDKITNKLKDAEMKAQAMRELLSDQAPTNSHKGFSFCIYVRICSCFACNRS